MSRASRGTVKTPARTLRVETLEDRNAPGDALGSWLPPLMDTIWAGSGPTDPAPTVRPGTDNDRPRGDDVTVAGGEPPADGPRSVPGGGQVSGTPRGLQFRKTELLDEFLAGTSVFTQADTTGFYETVSSLAGQAAGGAPTQSPGGRVLTPAQPTGGVGSSLPSGTFLAAPGVSDPVRAGGAGGTPPGGEQQAWRMADDSSGGSYSVAHDTALAVDVDGGVLSDLYSPSGGPLTASLVTGPASGVLDLETDGSFEYIPPAGFVGEVSFEVQPYDGATPLGPRTVYVAVTNDRPYSYDAEFEVRHDTPLSGKVDGQDNDGDDLTYTVVAGPATGTLDLDPETGDFTYTPATGYAGEVSFTFTVSDGIEDSETAAATIEVTNYIPVAAADAYAVVHDRVLNVTSGGLLQNDLDEDGDPVTVSLHTPPSSGSVQLDDDGTFVYTPAAGFVGEDVFWYVADDGVEESDPIPVAVSVVNHRPIAASSMHDLGFGLGFPVSSSVGASDGDGDTLIATLLTGPTAGTLTFNANGTFTYFPTNMNAVYDLFTYQVSDGPTVSNVGTVFLWRPSMVPPNGVAWGGAFTSLHDQPVDLGILAAEPSGSVGVGMPPPPPWYPVVTSPPAHGSVGNLSPYTPDAGFVGNDQFTFHITDGTLSSNSAPVILTIINNAPVTRADAYVTTQIDPLAGDVTTNDDDLDGDDLTAELVTAPDPDGGDFTFNPDGTFSFTPSADFAGILSFTYRLFDGAEWSLVATTFVTVQPVRLIGQLGISNGIESGVNTMNDLPPEIDAPSRWTVGAVTVANRNDTDADGTPDATDTVISPAAGGGGRQELDMMLVRLKKPALLGGRVLPNGTRVRAQVTNGPGVLWQFHSTPRPPGAPPEVQPSIIERQSKKSGPAPADFGLADFPAGGAPILLYLEATDTTAMRGITVKSQVRLPGSQTWIDIDEVRATGVWVTKTQVFRDRIPAQVVGGVTVPPALPATLVDADLRSRIVSDRVSAEDGSYFGAGPHSKERPAVPGAPATDTAWGGRILVEYQVAPSGAGSLAYFDMTRRANGLVQYMVAGTSKWEKQGERKLEITAEMGNDDGGDADEQRNPDQRVMGASANGKLYSWDSPGVAYGFLQEKAPVAFASFRSDFSEWVRIKPRASGDFYHKTPLEVEENPNEMQGSRASSLTPWHYMHHLAWNGTGFVRDTTATTVSSSTFTGPAERLSAMIVELVGDPPTEGVTAEFTNGTWTVKLASGASQSFIGPVGTVVFNVPNSQSQYRVTITQAAQGTPFLNGEKFVASVYKTARPTGKVTELVEGKLDDVLTE